MACVNGVINLNKPSGMSSSDAVIAVRRMLPKGTSVGHGGTLDPDAAGVLPICVGKATRLFDYIIDKDKTYIGELLLGVSTDTADTSGKPISINTVNVACQDVQTALKQFTGEIMQIPPMYSALKQDGKPLYKLARQGVSVDIPARKVRINSIEIIEQTASDRFLLKIVCGKGVYIRSLMRDIGDYLGVGGCMSFLLRSVSGAMRVEDSKRLDELGDFDSVLNALLPMDFMLQKYPRAVCPAGERQRILNGQMLMPSYTAIDSNAQAGDILRVYCENEFAGMGVLTDEGSVKLNAMLLDR